MFHFAVNYGSLGSGVDTDVPAINDGILSIRNGHHVPAEQLSLKAALPLGAQITRMRIGNASLQSVTLPYILPVSVNALPQLFEEVSDYRRNPIPYKSSEEIQYKVTNAVAGPTATYLLSWLEQSYNPPPAGQPYWIYGNSTTAAVANTWTLVSLTYNFNLPAGLYAVIGARYFATHGIGFQMIFPGQSYRPGGLGYAVEGVASNKMQVDGNMGVWGVFSTIALPQISVFNSSTDAAHAFYLQLVKVG